MKEGGYLIYSTCSYSHQENEDILDWLCREFELESIRIGIDAGWGIVETQSPEKDAWGYRFYPGKVKGEGLFAACLQKTGIQEGMPGFKNKEQQKIPAKEIAQVKTYIKEPDQLYYFKVNDEWMAINRAHLESLNILQRNLYIKKSGVRIGKLAGKDLIPDHELALSIIINKDVVLQTELSREQAIQYLRRDNLILSTAETGWSLMNFESHALGWAKLLPNRVNNYYPKELRILSKADG